MIPPPRCNDTVICMARVNCIRITNYLVPKHPNYTPCKEYSVTIWPTMFRCAWQVGKINCAIPYVVACNGITISGELCYSFKTWIVIWRVGQEASKTSLIPICFSVVYFHMTCIAYIGWSCCWNYFVRNKPGLSSPPPLTLLFLAICTENKGLFTFYPRIFISVHIQKPKCKRCQNVWICVICFISESA